MQTGDAPTDGTVTVERFDRQDLDGVLTLCRAEGWPSLPEDPVRALRALMAPGVVTVIARDHDRVVGFAQLLSDGEIQAYLACIAVETGHRGKGIGTRLIEAALATAGGRRIDLLSDESATGYYDRLPHRTMTGYRLYPPLDEPLPDK